MAFEVIPDAKLRMHLLGVFYRVAQMRDRRGDTNSVETHHMTGLPQNAKDLLYRSDAPSGKKLAMELVVRPSDLAQALLHRPSAGSRSGPPEHKALKYIPRKEWTPEERGAADDLELQIKALVHKWTESEGFFQLTVTGGNPYDPEEPLAFGEDGMTRAFRITWPGLKEAFLKIPGTEYAEIRSLKADVGRSIYSSMPDCHRGGA